MRIIGIEHVQFRSRDGEVVNFDKVTAVERIKPEKGEGETAYTFNVSPAKTQGLTVGQEVEVLYNRFGKVRRFDCIVD